MALSRSEQMARIGPRDTTPELTLRRALWARGLRYRVQYKTPRGKADIAFPGKKIAVFIDGCFWHGCPEHYVRPRSRAEFWADKLRANVQRDQQQTLTLEGAGWTVIRLWEHQIGTALDEHVARIESTVRGQAPMDEDAWRVLEAVPIDAEGVRERRVLIELRNPQKKRQEERRRTTKKW